MPKHDVPLVLIALALAASSDFVRADDVKVLGRVFADDSKNVIVTGTLKYENEFGDRWKLGFKGTVDGISSATPTSHEVDGVSSATRRSSNSGTVRGLSDNSLEEKIDRLGGFVGGYSSNPGAGYDTTPEFRDKRRVELSGFGRKEIDETALETGYVYSDETNYRSHTLYGTVEQAFALRNTIVSGTYYHNFDTVDASDEAIAQTYDYPKGKNVDGANLGLTQVLSRRTLAQIVLGGSWQRGALSDTERDVILRHPDNRWSLTPEWLPERRDRYAISGRVLQSLFRPASLELGYRYYTDSWGITSNTEHAALRVRPLPWLLFGLRGRLYAQTASDYSAFVITADDKFYSAAPVLQEFRSYLAGAHIGLIGTDMPSAGAEISGGLRLDWYTQTERDGVPDGYHAIIGGANLMARWM
ncbi:DUF3570 domain-containing protein [bacterium]|nr:DUF3570 domain-containing protein [bacterium]